ncbi:MAG: pantetheine-phosphate adenylyltransferase [Crocinitomix sp.]|nr:pantetheine-phosphate adenylyltransferase [Crocinitomix sp.]
MERIGIFPGSFDPFTKGHEDIVRRFLPQFDRVIIALGVNSKKKYMFDTDSRIEHIESLFKACPTVSVEAYEGLTVDFCQRKKAGYLLRGLRSSADFEFEKAIAQMNADISKGEGNVVETLFLMTDKNLSAISSSIVREIKKNNGNIAQFVTNEELLIINT